MRKLLKSLLREDPQVWSDRWLIRECRRLGLSFCFVNFKEDIKDENIERGSS